MVTYNYVDCNYLPTQAFEGLLGFCHTKPSLQGHIVPGSVEAEGQGSQVVGALE